MIMVMMMIMMIMMMILKIYRRWLFRRNWICKDEKDQMDNVKITNVKDSLEIDREPNNIEIIQVNPIHPQKKLKRQANLKDDYNKI